MEYRSLGQTDIEVSAICMGCWAIAGGPAWGDQDESEAIAAIHASLDAGVNFFDTAEAYGWGQSETILAKALGKRRKDVIIATKVHSALTREGIRKACQGSLKRLKTDHIDLYQVHWPNRNVPISDSMNALDELKREGKVRAIGVSNFGRRDLTDALAHGRVESNQVAYSLFWRAIEYEVRDACVESNVGILCYSALAQGLLTGKYATADDVPDGRARSRLFHAARSGARHGEHGCEAEVFEALRKLQEICRDLDLPMGQVALAWLLAQPGVTSVLAGSRSAEQATANAAAGDLKLSDDVIEKLAHVTDPVKARVGPNADMWQSESRIR